MKFNPQKIREESKKDFDKTWNEGKNIIAIPDINNQYPRKVFGFGKPHPIFETVQKLRNAYLRLGFEEAINPIIVEDKEIYKQFGYEALAVLDRCFYLSGLPRPNIGISEEQIEQIKNILDINPDIETIREIFHSYKKGDIEGDDLIADLSHRLDVTDSKIAVMLDKVFPEFKELTPVSSTKTLRSHMTSGWFITLSALVDKKSLPIKLFSVDRCFRREQREDPTRLMTYFSASCVFADEEVNIDTGKAVASALLSQFGFENFKFKPDDKRSKYYIPDTQTEVFAFHPKLVGSNTKYSSGFVEVATFGIYSPTALSQYDIPYPVMNLGMGVERLAMILHNADDVRALTYPQFQNLKLKDYEIACKIKLYKTPKTLIGREIQNSIIKICEEYGNTESPCEFIAWEGELFNNHIRVKVVEPEENTKLCGPAYLNEIVVHKGNILGIPYTEKWKSKFEIGIRTGIRFIDAFAALASANIEKFTHEVDKHKDKSCKIRIRIVKVPSEINIKIDPIAHKYITDNKKKIDIRGPVFTTVKVEY